MGVKPKKPKWLLDRVKELVATPGCLFLYDESALEHFPSVAAAYSFAKKVIPTLTYKDFEKTIKDFYDSATDTYLFCDSYGKAVTESGKTTGWYIKVTIDESIPQLVVISLHRLKWPIKTNGGIVQR